MTRAIALAACLGLAVVTGCGSLPVAGETEMQITDGAAFARARTYRIVVPDNALPGLSADNTTRVRAVVESSIDQVLGSKGYRKVAAEANADLTVQYRMATVARTDRDPDPGTKIATLTTVGGNDGATGYEPLAGSEVTSGLGRLVVYVDAAGGGVVWQGTSETEYVGTTMARQAAGRAAARLLRDVPRPAQP